jgi:hypothetical protein
MNIDASKSSHKRRRKTGHDDHSREEKEDHRRRQTHHRDGASTTASTPTSSRTSLPSWVASKDKNCPLNATFAVYGNCPNVASRYEKLNRIGEGTYGVVYRARDKISGDIVALKRCLPHHEASDGFPLTTLREITLLRELQSGGQQHGIVVLKDVAVSSRYVTLVLVTNTAHIHLQITASLHSITHINLLSITNVPEHQHETIHKSVWSLPRL